MPPHNLLSAHERVTIPVVVCGAVHRYSRFIFLSTSRFLCSISLLKVGTRNGFQFQDNASHLQFPANMQRSFKICLLVRSNNNVHAIFDSIRNGIRILSVCRHGNTSSRVLIMTIRKAPVLGVCQRSLPSSFPNVAFWHGESIGCIKLWHVAGSHVTSCNCCPRRLECHAWLVY